MRNLINHQSLLLIVTLSTLLSFNCAQTNSLYDPTNENIITLDWTNFTSTIEFKSNVFVVQFYKHWCPYCKRFAPTWKQLAEDIKLWKPIVSLAVINCANEENVGTCRSASIPFVPTIHFYPSNWNFSSSLKPIVIKKGTVEALRGNITTLLSTTSQTFADQFNYSEPVDLRDLARQSTGKKIFFVAERKESKTGTEVILDNYILYQFKDEVTIKRVNWKSPWFDQLRLNESQLPVLVTLPKRGFLPILVKTNQSVRNCRASINDFISQSIGKPNGNSDSDSPTDQSTPSPETPNFNNSNGNQLYVDDLYKCLQQILTNEILIYDNYSLEKVNSLKNFTQMVANYFPFTNSSPGEAFFNNLTASLESYESQLSSDNDTSLNGIPVTQLIGKINQLQDDYQLPKPNDWITCRGSDPIYRGYTCSLWLLWHTLSVNEYLMVDGHSGNQVAFTMRSFIRDFFSCEECRQHFIQETVDIADKIDRSDPLSSLRYIWSVHNSVNKRIAGDPTEDPYFPKVQFPRQSECPSCWTRGRFNDNQVTNFLLNRYKSSAWIHYEKTDN